MKNRDKNKPLPSEYVRDLIRHDLDRVAKIAGNGIDDNRKAMMRRRAEYHANTLTALSNR